MEDQVEMGVAAPVDEVMYEAPAKEAVEGNANGHVAEVVEGQEAALDEAAPVEDREGILKTPEVCVLLFLPSSVRWWHFCGWLGERRRRDFSRIAF